MLSNSYKQHIPVNWRLSDVSKVIIFNGIFKVAAPMLTVIDKIQYDFFFQPILIKFAPKCLFSKAGYFKIYTAFSGPFPLT